MSSRAWFALTSTASPTESGKFAWARTAQLSASDSLRWALGSGRLGPHPRPTGGVPPMNESRIESRIREGLTFDDVLLVPGASEVLPSEVDLRTQLTREIALNTPLFTHHDSCDLGRVTASGQNGQRIILLNHSATEMS